MKNSTPHVRIAMADRAQTANPIRARMSTDLLGHGADWWNGALIIALIAVAMAAVAVVAATMGVVIVQKRDAEQARHETESMRTANLKLEKEIAPRRLSRDQVSALGKLLEPFKGEKIRLESYALDAEGEVLASQIRDGLRSVLVIDDWVGSEEAGNGFAKGINVTGTNAALVTALAGAFKKVGLEGISTVPLPPPQTVLMALEKSRSKEKDVAAVVIVGVKPIKQ
jgi:hypothetical protein